MKHRLKSYQDLVYCRPTTEIGYEKASRIWANNFKRYNLNLNGSLILDWGCSWGYFLKYINDNYNPSGLIGNDIKPFWDSSRKNNKLWDYKKIANMKFVLGDLYDVDIPYAGQLDYIFSIAALQYMRPEQLFKNLFQTYFFLRPGGELLLRFRVYGSFIGNGVFSPYFEEPYLHLLSNRRLIADFLAKKGKRIKYVSYLTPSTYLAMFARIGFEVLDFRRKPNPKAQRNTQEILDKFPWISSEELNCSDITVRLMRPIESESKTNTSKLDEIMRTTPEYLNSKKTWPCRIRTWLEDFIK